MINDQFIIKTFSNINGNIRNNWKKYLTSDIIEYLDNRFIEKSRSYKEAISRIFYKYEEIPKCKICGKLCYFNGGNIRDKLYKSHCNNKECYQQLNIIHGKETCKKRYGNENYRNTEKTKLTCLEKYGVEYVVKTELMKNKSAQTKLKKYNNEHYNNTQKCKQTCIQKYGVDNVFKSNKIKEKIKKIKKEKYNDIFYTNRSQFIKTCNNLYGGCGAKSDIIKQKMQNTCLLKYNKKCVLQVDYIIEKRKQTCLEKYGYTTYTQTDEYKKYISDSKIQYNKQYKEYLTKKKNNSFNKSIPENQTYELLKQKYPDVIHQYKSKEYPFNCDFYIPSINTYIECNYSWVHGPHSYDLNNENDKLLLETWQSKNTEYYNNAITTWTIRDVNKRNIAKQNNLNYIEFWNINEVKEWLK